MDNIFLLFGSKLYRQIAVIPMGINCAPLVEDLFLFCYERDVTLSLSDNNQTDVVKAFNSISIYEGQSKITEPCLITFEPSKKKICLDGISL